MMNFLNNEGTIYDRVVSLNAGLRMERRMI
jgi:hypothetical protein